MTCIVRCRLCRAHRMACVDIRMFGFRTRWRWETRDGKRSYECTIGEGLHLGQSTVACLVVYPTNAMIDSQRIARRHLKIRYISGVSP